MKSNTSHTIQIEPQQSTISLEVIAAEDETIIDYIETDDGEYAIVEQSEKTIENKPFPCEMCHEAFGTRDERNEHIQTHFNVIDCPVCQKTFIGDRQFNYHQQTGRCKPNANAKIPPIADGDENDEDNEDVDDDGDVDEDPLETGLNAGLNCAHCGKEHFQSTRSLRLHINKTHLTEEIKNTSKEENICTFCNKQFANRHILKNHITEIHTNAQQHKCDDCGKLFNRLANLRHHQLIHRNEMPCKCTICGKAFRTSSGVRLHIRTHTGERPYKCDLCDDRAYAYNTDLVRHKRSAHGICGKVYQCELCPSFYYERKHYRYHMGKLHPGMALKEE